jgi:hypothetical protein
MLKPLYGQIDEELLGLFEVPNLQKEKPNRLKIDSSSPAIQSEEFLGFGNDTDSSASNQSAMIDTAFGSFGSGYGTH